MSKGFYIGLALGAALTGVISYFYFNKKKEEEIESVRASFYKLLDEKNELIKEAAKGKSNPYSEPVKTERLSGADFDGDAVVIIPTNKEAKTEKEYYNKVKPYNNAVKHEEFIASAVPVIIDEEEFGSIVDYRMEDLEYYANDILVDDEGKIIRAVVSKIGKEAYDKILNQGIEEVFIRDDILKSYFRVINHSEEPYEEW